MNARSIELSGPESPAAIRTIRLAAGTSLALAAAEGIGWNASYLCPVFVSFLLALPLPVPSLKGGIGFVLTLVASLLLGLMIVPLINHTAAPALLLIALALFLAFRFAASGGSPLLSSFFTLGIVAVPVVGSESVDLAIGLVKSLGFTACTAMLFVWLAHALFPDAPQPAATPARVSKGAPATDANRLAVRATLVVTPLILCFLALSGAASYLAVLIKAMSLGQQACTDQRRDAARTLIASTLIGGAAALAIWAALRIWPSLLVYTLLVLLAGFWFGRRVFSGRGLAANGAMWSYALLTALVVIGPTAAAGEGGPSAMYKILVRILMMLAASVYAAVAVFLFDRLLPRRKAASGDAARRRAPG